MEVTQIHDEILIKCSPKEAYDLVVVLATALEHVKRDKIQRVTLEFLEKFANMEIENETN